MRVCLLFRILVHDLVKAAIAEDIPVVALPGASAGITALIASGLAPQPHIFYGFLPVKKVSRLIFSRKSCLILRHRFFMSRLIVWQIPLKICMRSMAIAK